ncbi:hypothetical protein [Terasakiella pusilla]|uniref:hypothetical protein n=1 Tax=Terasakiella pusilla TaxID=64973 RepID=UPI003AA9A673
MVNPIINNPGLYQPLIPPGNGGVQNVGQGAQGAQNAQNANNGGVNMQPAPPGGALQGHNIGAGNAPGIFSQIKNSITNFFDRIGAFFRPSPPVPMNANPTVAQLNTPSPHGLLQTAPGLDARMDAYRQDIGSPLSQQDVRDLINTGEKIMSAIQHSRPNADGSYDIQQGGHDVNVRSNTHTTLALSWYMMAKAGADGDDSLIGSGSMLMKDPGNKVYNFLSSAPTAYDRISTHFNERSASPINHGHATQRGIEDFESRMPSKKGAICFDKLNDPNGGQPDLFVKIEGSGMPPVFRGLAHHGDEGTSTGTRVLNAFKSIGRQFQHCTSFISTRFAAPDGGNFQMHREHINKDAQRDIVFQPFSNAMNLLTNPNDPNENAGEAFIKQGQKYGLGHIEAQLYEISGALDLLDDLTGNQITINGTDYTADLNALRAAVDAALDGCNDFRQEDNVGNDYGVVRKGAEVHIGFADTPDFKTLEIQDAFAAVQNADDQTIAATLKDQLTTANGNLKSREERDDVFQIAKVACGLSHVQMNNIVLALLEDQQNTVDYNSGNLLRTDNPASWVASAHVKAMVQDWIDEVKQAVFDHPGALEMTGPQLEQTILNKILRSTDDLPDQFKQLMTGIQNLQDGEGSALRAKYGVDTADTVTNDAFILRNVMPAFIKDPEFLNEFGMGAARVVQHVQQMFNAAVSDSTPEEAVEQLVQRHGLDPEVATEGNINMLRAFYDEIRA